MHHGQLHVYLVSMSSLKVSRNLGMREFAEHTKIPPVHTRRIFVFAVLATGYDPSVAVPLLVLVGRVPASVTCSSPSEASESIIPGNSSPLSIDDTDGGTSSSESSTEKSGSPSESSAGSSDAATIWVQNQ